MIFGEQEQVKFGDTPHQPMEPSGLSDVLPGPSLPEQENEAFDKRQKQEDEESSVAVETSSRERKTPT